MQENSDWDAKYCQSNLSSPNYTFSKQIVLLWHNHVLSSLILICHTDMLINITSINKYFVIVILEYISPRWQKVIVQLVLYTTAIALLKMTQLNSTSITTSYDALHSRAKAFYKQDMYKCIFYKKIANS